MQTEMQTALILIRLFFFRPVLFAQKSCKVAVNENCKVALNEKLKANFD